jgi:hypothetical protein
LDDGARVEERLSCARADLVDERADGMRRRWGFLLVESGRDVRLEQGVGQYEGALAVRADLAAPEDEARDETDDVVSPRTNEGVVEVVEVEEDALVMRPRARRDRERAGAVGAEVLEVSISDEPPLAARTVREGRVAIEELVVKRRRAS